MCFCIFTTVNHRLKKGKTKYLLEKKQQEKRTINFIMRSKQLKLEKTATQLLDQRFLRNDWKNKQTPGNLRIILLVLLSNCSSVLTRNTYTFQGWWGVAPVPYVHTWIHNQPSHTVRPQGITV